MDWLFDLPIIAGPVPFVVYAISLGLLLAILIRRPRLGWVLGVLLGFAIGALLAVALLLVLGYGMKLIEPPPPLVADVVIAATLAAVGIALGSLVGAAAWRKAVAIVGAVFFLLAGTLGVNAIYGLNPTLGSFFGIVVDHPIDIPTSSPQPTETTDDRPLYQRWQPPADMPAQGKTGTVSIPATASGFPARTTGIYLPPAAQVANPPRLPLVIVMLGQPGSPDTAPFPIIFDAYANAHQGLAPIVLVVDQLSDPNVDPMCLDGSPWGNVETYVTQDVVQWAKANLPVLEGPEYWAIGGYSNGGGCAFKWAAEHPEIWGGLIDTSGELFAGSESPDQAVSTLWGGDQAAFEAAKPSSILASGAHEYPDTVAVFTAGDQDPSYIQAMQSAAQAATAAGWHVTTSVLPNTSHGADALVNGFTFALQTFYPRWGLSAGS